MEFDGTEYNKEHFEKPPVTPERLAEILGDIMDKYNDPRYIFNSVAIGNILAAELLKVCEIREKEVLKDDERMVLLEGLRKETPKE